MGWLLKRWWFWAGTAFMLVAVCAGYLLIPFPAERGRINQATCDKIQIGWKWTQMQEFMGPCDHLTAEGGVKETLWTGYWKDEDGAEIQVTTEAFVLGNAVVQGKRYVPSKLPALELLKRRITRRIKALWP
jgi:hypothetical protein